MCVCVGALMGLDGLILCDDGVDDRSEEEAFFLFHAPLGRRWLVWRDTSRGSGICGAHQMLAVSVAVCVCVYVVCVWVKM